MECGQRVAATAPSTALESPAPRQVAEPAARDALAGERKQVTILFADVVGSTALIQGRDDEEAQHLLDGAVQRMVDAVQQFDGTVSRKMGDGVMALFGAPIAHEDHALRACSPRWRCWKRSRASAEEAHQAYGTTVQIRVGINSGGVIVRDLSDAQFRDYSAMGTTVHLAKRMEEVAAPGTALLSPATLALVEGYVEVRSRGTAAVKGFDGPIEVHELVGAGAARTRLQVATARGLTPFVGRQASARRSTGHWYGRKRDRDRSWRWSRSRASVSRACCGR